ncbi:MAG: hypothetical protein WCO79_02185 [bacterium]
MSFEQIPLFEESRESGKTVLIETAAEKKARLAAEAKAAFARIQEVVKNSPSWEELKRSGHVDDGRLRHTRKLRSGSESVGETKEGWMKGHEARQDERAEQFSPEADRPELTER